MKKKLGSILFLLVLFLGSPIEALAVDYAIEAYKVDVSILENGTVAFDHAITYDFDGEFNGFLYTLDYFGYQKPTNIEVTVADSQGKESSPFIKNSSQFPGTFKIYEGISNLDFTVFESGKNETKTVHYKYEIPGMIVNYLDTAEFNHKVIGGNWEDRLKNVEIVIQLPKAVAADELKAWAHGTLRGSVKIKDSQTVILTVDSNPSKQFIEAHLVFPTYVTPANPHIKDQKALKRILIQEEKLAEEANAKRMRVFWSIAALCSISLITLIGGVIWIRVLSKKEKKENAFLPDHLYELPDHLYELPADLTPAVMYSAVKNRNPRPVDLSATIMDLARKKQVRLTEIYQEKDKKGKKQGKKETTYLITRLSHPAYVHLLPHEKYAMRWLLKKIGSGKEVSLQAIKNYGKDNAVKAKNFNTNYQKWQKMVRTQAGELKYFSRYNTRAVNIAILTSFLLFICMIATLIIMGIFEAFYVSAIIITIGSFVVSLFHGYYMIPIRTVAGEKAAKEWTAFKKMLKNVSNLNMAEVGSLVLWDHFLVYAISLGVSKKVIKELKIQFPKESIDTMDVGYYYHSDSMFSSSTFQSSFESSFTSAVGRANSDMSSSGSGSGGGFSGGSSGGGGGGSGGGAF
ncbi:DUF2207 domain-containing protein [Carnobacterium sp.]|uniref:DUF2207 domain-containing protein n=1 Tax=Carnobacterium sp. TaxID=48221 RepID=UPI0028AB03E3|nr:DUF2207 domain-containing protein [Carnobacterium sp.]